uniref:Retrotransposon Copia-like N-terminal domain-containing protein n=1 Tax=Cajanus cajan TaxID=3821 RepID=A0A151QTM7_CAJCA|nr:hypothetical protein KK1_045453 [Cajanus cajan]
MKPLIELTIATSLPIKLNSTNHHTWYNQITHLLKANDLFGYVTGETACPPPKTGSEGNVTTNPEYTHWQ